MSTSFDIFCEIAPFLHSCINIPYLFAQCANIAQVRVSQHSFIISTLSLRKQAFGSGWCEQCTVCPIFTIKIKNFTESGQSGDPNYLTYPYHHGRKPVYSLNYGAHIIFHVCLFDRENIWCAPLRTSSNKNYYILILK